MISRDTGCRPHEILKLRIKDVVFKTTTADEGNRQYAEVLVNGNTGSRHIPLINSIPYVKDWLDQHPQQGNPNAPLICGYGKSLGRRLNPIAITKLYERYKIGLFAKLLESPNVSVEDKQKIKELLRKPWNPYIRRHSALREIRHTKGTSSLLTYDAYNETLESEKQKDDKLTLMGNTINKM